MKTIIFDFDGTLTVKNSNIWKYLWKKLGYDISQNSAHGILATLFFRKKINYEKWVELTTYYFKRAGLNKKLLNNAINETTVLDGCLELFKHLKQKGYDIHIVSGGIKQVILESLGSATKYCSNITSNELVFNDFNFLNSVIATPYDYEGKAVYVQKLVQEKGLTPNDILFIGNSDNDEFVYKTGCKTLCINPDNANCGNKTIWNNIIETDNLLDLLPIIENIFKEQKEK